MAELKVTSKKYNDKDVLEVEGDVLATKIEVSNIEALTDKQLDALKVGDVVEKKTGNQKHCYIVTYKGEGAGEGICLSYFACGYLETISYDRTVSGWVFNSKDVCETLDGDSVLGLLDDELGLIKDEENYGCIFNGYVDFTDARVSGLPSGGTQLYKHTVYFSSGNELNFISTQNKKLSEFTSNEAKEIICLCPSGGSIGRLYSPMIIITTRPTVISLYALKVGSDGLEEVSYNITSDASGDSVSPL